jgi:serine protease
MQVNKNCLLAVAVPFIISIFLLGCVSSSSTSISGKLTVSISETAGAGFPEVIPGQPPLPLPPNRTPIIALVEENTADFVADEIIVKYRPGMDPVVFAGATSSGGYSVLRSDDKIADGALSILRLDNFQKSSLSTAAVKERTLLEIDRLNALPYVEFAQPNYIYKPLADPNDDFYSLQWHYPLIKLDKVWNEDPVQLQNLSTVTVAVIDTGIARSNGTKSGANHPDYGNIVDEYDFISSSAMSLDGGGIDSDATDPGDDPTGQFSSFHGTHVIGTIGALTNNSTGVAGVAGRADKGNSINIMPIRVLGNGGGTSNDIAQAIRYAAGLSNDSGTFPTKAAEIINMSLGTTANDPLIESAVSAAYSGGSGSLIIAAAGNAGTTTPFYPAAYPKVISVSAVDIGAEIAPYSNRGSTIDIAAPGGSFSFDLNFDTYVDGVLSTFVEFISPSNYDLDLYAFYQGTSMAAPHVSGLAALLKATGLSASQIRNNIESNAIDLGATGKDNLYGNGLINTYKSIKVALSEVESPILFPFPKIFKLEGNNPSDSFTLKNIGGGSPINISSISKKNSSTWLTVNPTLGSADSAIGLQVDIDINTTSFPSITDGDTYTEMLTIQSDAEDESVFVLYNKNGFTTASDIGLVYVVALDPSTGEILEVDTTSVIDTYEYSLSNVSSGDYIIGASTDRDGDLLIFEPEDAIGFYISLDQVETIQLSSGENLKNIDFNIVNPAL